MPKPLLLLLLLFTACTLPDTTLAMVSVPALVQSLGSVFDFSRSLLLTRMVYNQFSTIMEIKRESMTQFFKGLDELKFCLDGRSSQDFRTRLRFRKPPKRTGSCVVGPLRTIGGSFFFASDITALTDIYMAALGTVSNSGRFIGKQIAQSRTSFGIASLKNLGWTQRFTRLFTPTGRARKLLKLA